MEFEPCFIIYCLAVILLMHVTHEFVELESKFYIVDSIMVLIGSMVLK